jgi:DNA processing protein
MAIDVHDEYRAALALRHTPGIGPRTRGRIAAHFDSLTEAASRCQEWVGRKLANKRQAQAFADRLWKDPAELEYQSARSLRLRVLVHGGEHYPAHLRDLPDPPLCLYYKGDRKLLSNPGVAVVGARHCSNYGLESARNIASELSSFGVTIISGMATGIDRQAHQAGLAGPGRSIGVLGTGLDKIYPADNADLYRAMAEQGLVVTEFAPGTKPEGRNFPIRNRIISGLSLGVLVAEAASRSGSLITARLALEQGRDVFALPGPLTQPTFTGCHSLIRSGALLVQSAEDIVRELRPHLETHLSLEATPQGNGPPTRAPRPAPRLPADLLPEERDVMEWLTGKDKVHIDTLGRDMGLPSPQVSCLLLQLEIKGLVRQWPGMYYSAP